MPQPVARPSESYPELEIGDDVELAVTHRFVRVSAPYERIELDLDVPSLVRHGRPTRFVRTVRVPEPAATLSFDKHWFDQPEDTIAAIEDVPAESRASWSWLVISLAVAGAALGLASVAL